MVALQVGRYLNNVSLFVFTSVLSCRSICLEDGRRNATVQLVSSQSRVATAFLPLLHTKDACTYQRSTSKIFMIPSHLIALTKSASTYKRHIHLHLLQHALSRLGYPALSARGAQPQRSTERIPHMRLCDSDGFAGRPRYYSFIRA